ncbi:hypothetical protein ABPG77_007185 [Micractinium sp. CCAP 211/92]
MLTASGPPASRLLGQPSCSPLRRATAKPGSSIALRGRKAALRVASRYAGSGAPPPQQYRPPLAGAPPQQPSQQQYRAPPSPTQQPPMQQPTQAPQQQQYRPPMQQQPRQQQRAPLPSTRRVGVSPRLQQQQQQQPPAQQQRAGSLQQLATSAAAVLPAQSRADTSTEAVQARAGQHPPAEVNLSRSQLMDKEVITRTSANRLGYVNQLFVDPGSLSVVSVYLRKAASSLSSLGESAADQDHLLLDSLQQVSDVVLVHDENALEAFPLDDTMGYCRLVGAEVVTETGISLGKVRDYLFSPDSGAISTIKYDKLGVPSLPQALLSCYSISWEDVKALGPTRLVVYSGTELRAIKENDGIVDEGVSLLVNIIAGPEKDKGRDGAALAGAAQPAAALGMGDDSRYRTDQAYYDWYVQHGAEYERQYGVKLDPPAGWADAAYAAQQRAPPAPPPARRPPPALPPPQASTFAQAVQPSQPAQQQGYQQQMFQQQRQAVPAGASSWGAPPSSPPPQQQQYAAPPPQQRAPARGPPPQSQQPRQQSAQQAQQPPLPPQNGIPIIDRTPLPPYRRRDADGNYGSPPAQQQQAPQQRAAPQQQQQRAPPATAQQWQQPRAAAGRQQAPAMGQPAQPTQRQPPVVVPDAVIPGGSAGSSGGATQVAEFRQL